MNITISIMSLATNKWDYWDIKDLESYNNAIVEFNEKYNVHDGDYEIQLIESNISSITDSNLYPVLKIKSDNDEWVSIIAAIYNYYNNERDTLEVLNNQYYEVVYADNEKEAIQEYIKELNLIEIPDYLENYIDWEQIYIDYKCNGYTTINISDDKWIVIKPW